MLTTYFEIIRRAIRENRSKGGETYYEAHHIVPSCFEEFGKKSSTVLLTAEEHYRVHKILVECFKDHPLYAYKVYWAFHRMSYDGSKTLTEQEYKEAREILMPLWKRKKSIEHRKNIGRAHKGRKQIINSKTGEFKLARIEELENYLNSGWTNTNRSVGSKRTEESKRLISEKAKLSQHNKKSLRSKGVVVCENINTGEKVEAESANKLAKKLDINVSVFHEELNRHTYANPCKPRSSRSKYYNFLQTHRIYYKQ